MATDRYATNQFYKLDAFEPYANPYGGTFDDNPPFIYPPQTLRNPTNGTSTPIQRGYLRMMAELLDKEKFGQLSRRRLHFQFNPDNIVRSVSARNDIQLWMNQDPSQITQPIPGDMNFAFELLFNREAEVTSGKYVAPNMYAAAGTTSLATSALPANLPIESGNKISQYNVTDIGVLADLLVFDELIGQGLNSQLLEAMVERATVGAAYAEAQKANAAKDSTKDEQDQTPTTQEFSKQSVQDALNANWGNSAFLISQPIRVVFSSLFIVEGYVTATTVTFNKFTPTMVPVQAVVGIQMQAMYIGFGKKETFFTKTFAANEEKYQELVSKQDAEQKGLKVLGKNVYSQISTTENGTDYSVDPSRFLGTNGAQVPLKIRVKSSDDLKSQIKDANSISKVTVSANLKISYLGNKATPSSPYTLPTGVTTALNEEVYNDTVTVDLSTDKLSGDNPWCTAELLFPTIQSIVGTNYDKSSTAYYWINFSMITTIVGSGGSSVECDQTIKATLTTTWGTTLILESKATLHVDNSDTIAAIKAAAKRGGENY